MIKVGLSSSADLNVSLSGGAADAGITYEAVGGKFTVNSAGVVTPIKSGVGLVVVKNTTNGEVLKKIAVAIVPDEELVNLQNIQSVATTVVSAEGTSNQSGSSVAFVDQEVVTFDSNGQYILASAPSGIMSDSVPMLTFNGVIQDGATASKRFDVVNDDGGVKRKLQLYAYETVNNFIEVNGVELQKAGGTSSVVAMTSDSTQVSGSNVQTTSASSIYGTSYEAWKLVDKNDTAAGWASGTGLASNPQWWRIDFAQPVTFELVQFRARTDVPNQSPRTFEIQASTDNFATHDVLYAGSDLTWVAGEVKQFANPNPATGYTSIRVYVTASLYGDVVSFSEFDLLTGGYSGLGVNNTNKFVKVQDSSLVLGADDFTVEAWINPASTAGYNFIWGSDGGFVFGLASADGVYFYSNGWVANHGSWQTELTLNQWNHVALVRNGSNIKIFINGNLITQGTTTANFVYDTWGVGNDVVTGTETFPGLIRNLRVTKAARYSVPFTPFAVSEDVTQLSDAYSESDVLRASFDALVDGNITWSAGTPLLPGAQTTCLVSYRV